MVSVVDALGLAVILFANAAVTALLTRFFRVRLKTRWGSVAYVFFLVPPALVVVVLLLSGVFGLGPNLGSPGTVVGITVLLPLSVGVAFDYFWMPAPEEIDLPEKWDRQEPDRYER
jgi:hypothetical protein